MAAYNAKGRQSGVQTWKIAEVKGLRAGYEATIHSTFTDEKGKELTKATGTFQCSGGALRYAHVAAAGTEARPGEYRS